MPCGLFHESYPKDERIFQTVWVKAWLAAFLVFLFTFPLFNDPLSQAINSNLTHLFIMIMIYIIGAHGLNLLTGFTGQISLGHGAFMGVGAYTAGILAARLGWPVWLTLPAAGLMTAAVGMIFGVPSLRLKGLYLAIATMAAQFIIHYVMRNWTSMTGGSSGLIVPSASLFGFGIDTDKKFYYLVLVIVILFTLFTKNLTRTRPGRAFVAIRDRYLAAEVIGVNLFKYRIMSFGVSSFYVGVAGGLLAYYSQIVSDEQFTIWLSIQYLGMCIIGGLGHVLGAVFGAVFMVVLPELLRIMAEALNQMTISPDFFLGPALTSVIKSVFSFEILGTLQEGIFGLIIILFLVFEPDGLAARWHTIRNYWKLWPFSY
ncbi:MAG: branched-chain amino acid ABC transporter permease [Pseudomonadota bacterium]